ncbi:hypothetical protein [Rhodococcoides fascians]|uniref:hypothetical protein n=1 Tax=Rhodococcoides fascians TaxID=1828 RepID=UPI00050CD0B7|nr:hypothetical protein [Rhodococcus fascians]
MSDRFTDATMVAVQVEVAREDVWVPDGMPPATYPPNLLLTPALMAMPDDTELRPTTTPIAGQGMWPIEYKDAPLTSVSVASSVSITPTPRVTLTTKKDAAGDNVVTGVTVGVTATGTVTSDVEPESSRTIGPIVVQTKIPTPVSAGDTVSFGGQYAIRRPGPRFQYDSLGERTAVRVRTSVWGVRSTSDEYGMVSTESVELLGYETELQPQVMSFNSYVNVLVTLPTVSPIVVPAGVTGVHLTVALRSNNGAWFSTAYVVPKRKTQLNQGVDGCLFTFSSANPLSLTVTPKPTTPGVPAASWETLTQEQNRLHRWTFENVTDDVVSVTTDKVEAELGVTAIRFVSDTAPTKVVAGKRMRILALHPDGTFTTVLAGTVRSRRIVLDGWHRPQLEVGVHDCHAKLSSTECPVAFDDMNEYAPILNKLGVVTHIGATEVTGPARPMPAWGGVFPSFTDDSLRVLGALLLVRNARKAFLRITRRDAVELLPALDNAIQLDLSDVPGEGDMSYSLNAEFGSDTTDIVNCVAVEERLLDSEDFEKRSFGVEIPPADFGYLDSRRQTAEYRNENSIDTYGLARRSFPVVRGTGLWTDLETGQYGSNFAVWAAQILAEYSGESVGPKSITLPVVTAADRRRVAALEVLDAIVVRSRGAAYVRRIRRISHEISPGSWLVRLRFDVTGDQVYWLPPTAVPLIVLGDTDAGTLSDPSTGLVDGRYPNEPDVYELDGGTL